MNETQTSEVNETTEKELPGPQGIGMAVSIDWGLAVQMILLPIISLRHPSVTGTSITGTIILIPSLLSSVVFVWFGEMVRRGHNWTRLIQIIFNVLLTLGGLFALISLYQSISKGNFWPIITEIILIIISPLIVWRMTRPATTRWFKTVTVAEARKRHGGKWVAFIALFAIIGGVLQVLAATLK